MERVCRDSQHYLLRTYFIGDWTDNRNEFLVKITYKDTGECETWYGTAKEALERFKELQAC